MLRRVSRCVKPTDTTMFCGDCCWISPEYSFETGHLRSEEYRLVVPSGYPFEGPSSLICGMRSRFRSHPVVCPAAHTVQARVSLTVPIGFTRERIVWLIGWLYRLPANFSAVPPFPITS